VKAIHTISLLFCLLLELPSNGQHTPLTSQYLFNGLLINPAYAGSRDALAANITHRQQWVGFSGAPVTQILSVHAPVNRRKVGLGLMLYNDRIGVSNETALMTNYAYRIRFPNGKLAFGIGAGVTLLRGDWQTVAIQDGQDAVFMEPTRSAFRPNFSAGAYYYSKSWFVGLSAPFILLHQYGGANDGYRVADVRPDLQTMVTGGYLWELSPDIKLKPAVLLRYRMEASPQIDLNTNVILREKLWLGISYRTQDAVVAMVEVLPTPQWRFGYAYDMGVSALRPYHHGSHELMVQYELGYRIRVRDPRYF
jgi:type IX secretion system PorP/SprF family membrane protein